MFGNGRGSAPLGAAQRYFTETESVLFLRESLSDCQFAPPLWFPPPQGIGRGSLLGGEEAGSFGGLNLAQDTPSSPPVKTFHADPGVIQLGHSPGSLLAPVRHTCLTLEERG